MSDRGILFSAPMVREILADRKTQTRRLVNLDELRIDLPGAVRSDGCAGWGLPELVAKAGRWRAQIHDQGAVSIHDGRLELTLGVKPGEFHFVCPYTAGETHLGRYGEHDADRWTIIPEPGSRLWVRETWRTEERESDSVDGIRFRADGAFVPIENTQEAADRWVALHKNGRPARGKAKEEFPSTSPWRSSIHLPRWASRIRLDVKGVRIERLNDISHADIRAEGVSCPEHDFPSGFCVSECRFLRSAFIALWDGINGDGSYDSNPWVWRVSFSRAS